eukprot:10118178-Ditylum_brightwellii.AAC.1
MFPWIMYDYKEDGANYVTVDWLVPAFSKNIFHPMVKSSGSSLLTSIVPAIFFSKDCLMAAHGRDFSGNTHKATSFKDVVIHIDKLHIDENKNSLEFLGQYQVVKTPFDVKETIVDWEVQAFPNDDEAFFEEMDEKRRNRVGASGFCKITSPASKVQRHQGFISLGSRHGEGGSDMVMDNDIHEPK